MVTEVLMLLLSAIAVSGGITYCIGHSEIDFQRSVAVLLIVFGIGCALLIARCIFKSPTLYLKKS